MTNPTVTIEIKAIDKGAMAKLKAVRVEAEKLSGTKRRLSRRVKKTGESFKKSGKSVGRFSEIMKDLETNAVLALGPLSGVGARVRAIGVLARRGNIGIIAFSVGLTAVIAAASILVIGMFKVRKELEAIESRFMAVTGSVLATKAGMEDALSVARRFGVNFKAAADGLSQLAAAARGTILEGEGVRRVFEGASAAVGALRLGITQAQGIFKALEQIMTKGVVRAEELNQQLGDQLPGAAKIMASALGISTQKLQEMMRTGSLLAEDVLPKFAEELLNLFGPQATAGADSLQGALNRVSTELTILLDIMETRSGVIAFFTGELSDLAIAISNIGERMRSTKGEIKLFFRALERDRRRFTTIGISRQEREDAIASIRELQAALLTEMEPLQLTIARTEGGVEGGILAREFKFASRELAPLLEQFNKLEAAVQELKGFDLLPGAKKTGPTIDKITKAFDKLVLKAATAEKVLIRTLSGDILGAEFKASLGKAEQILSKFSDKVKEEFANKMGVSVSNLSNQFAQLIQDAKDFKTLGKIFEETRTPLEKFVAEMAKLEELMERYKKFPEVVEAIKRKMLEINPVLSTISASIKSFGSDFVSAIRDGKSVIDVLTSSFSNLLAKLLEVMIQMLILGPLLKSLGLPGGSAAPSLSNFFGLLGLGGGGGFASLPFLPLAHGADFTVRGRGGVDTNLVPLRLTAGERVRVTPAGETGGDGQTIVNNFNFPPGTNVREFGDSQSQIAAMVAGTMSAASQSNS